MGSRTVGLLAVIGGLASTIGIGLLAAAMQARPDELFWNVVTDPTQQAILAVSGVVGILAMSAATAGLASLLIDRIDPSFVLIAVVAGLGGVLGLMRVGAGFILFVVGSATFMLYLARAHVMNPWIAVGHALAAAGWVVVLGVALTRNPLGWTIVLALFYPVSWILIGAWVLRGLPHEEPSSPMPGGA